MNPTIPAVKVPDHTDPFGIGCPNGKAGTRDMIQRHRVSAEDPVDMMMATLAEEVKVKVREDGSKRIGVYLLTLTAGFVVPSDDVVLWNGIPEFDPRLKEIGPRDSNQLRPIKADTSPLCKGEEGSEHLHAIVPMTSKDLKRVMVARAKKTLEKRV